MGTIKINQNGKVTYEEISWENCRKVKLSGRKKFYKTDEIRTISYYGGKYKFQNLFLEIYRYCKESLGCSVFADGFCGSGILSIMASKLDYQVYMNDGSDLVVNFHHLMKENYQKFYYFMYYIQVWDQFFYGDFDRQEFKRLGKELRETSEQYLRKIKELDLTIKCCLSEKEVKQLKKEKRELVAEKKNKYRQQRETINQLIKIPKSRYKKLAAMINNYSLEGHKYRGSVSVKKAVCYYLYRNYTFEGSSSYAPNAKPAVYGILDLVNVQKYYKNVVEIENLYYKKFISKFLFDEHALIMLDPPYWEATRSDRKAYSKWEFSEKKHRYFLEIITQPGIKAKIIVSGYSNSFYDRRLAKYNREKGCHWQKVRLLKAGNAKRGALEVIWVNFDFKPLEAQLPELFKVVPEDEWDYSYRHLKNDKATNIEEAGEEIETVEDFDTKEDVADEDEESKFDIEEFFFSQLEFSSKRQKEPECNNVLGEQERKSNLIFSIHGIRKASNETEEE